jgi:Family of unknown function (DUF5683)
MVGSVLGKGFLPYHPADGIVKTGGGRSFDNRRVIKENRNGWKIAVTGGIPGMKPKIAAAILSAIVPGAGQFYNRHWIKGVAFLAAIFGLMSAIHPDELIEGRGLAATLVVLLLTLAVAIWSVVDAYRCGRPS